MLGEAGIQIEPLRKEDQMRITNFAVLLGSLGIAVLASLPANTASHGSMDAQDRKMMDQGMMSPGLEMPAMDPARGRRLFASKGCVVCHSVNGVGGEDAPPLDASTMNPRMNPFEFAAKMWQGAEPMIYLQREELGEQIELRKLCKRHRRSDAVMIPRRHVA